MTWQPLHPWMWRFGLPGWAETVWVLPEGVRHDDLALEPIEPKFVELLVRRWDNDGKARDTMERIHRAYLDRELRLDALQTLGPQISSLLDAVSHGRLVVWGLGRTWVRAPAVVPLPVLPVPIPPPPPPPPPSPSPLPARPNAPREPCPECPDMEIEISDTSTPTHNVVLIKCEHPAHRSKTPCRIRVKVPCTGGSTQVVLVNPPRNGGRVRFPEDADTTTTLSVPSDGSWASFEISGEIASRQLDDALIEAHCKNESGKITATATVTVVSFDPVTVSASPVGKYELSSAGVFATTIPVTPAVNLSASATINPQGVDLSAPQLQDLQIGLLQNVLPGDNFTATYSNPKMIKWDDGAHPAVVPTTIRKVDFLVGVHNDSLSLKHAPLYSRSDSALVDPGETAASADTPDKAFDLVIPQDAFDLFGQHAGTVEYTLVKAQVDISFVLWAVVVHVSTQKSARLRHIGEICALRERTWELHFDSTVTQTPQRATEGAADMAPTMDPVTTGLLANENRLTRVEAVGSATTTLKK